VIRMEEERFFVTLHEGMRKVEEILARTRQQGAELISGADAFMMYDTYGFPLDLMEDVASENGFEVDTEGFGKMMEQQRDRARSANKGENAFAQDRILAELLAELPATFFSGYDRQEDQSQVTALLVDNEKVNEAYGKEIILVTAVTPFYAQSGGQIADSGIITGQNGTLKVMEVHKIADWILHYGELDGKISVDEQVVLTVDKQRRLDTARNHTATHLLHLALRQVLGDHAQQKGSLVEPERLRFDFSHLTAVTEAELCKIEKLVNEAIWSMHDVSKVVKSLDEAREMGAVALFGEKYGDQVRVVSVGDISMELCGGTHVSNTGEIGLFKLLSEGSVGSGLRRIEAVTGRYALEYLNRVEKDLKSIAAALRVTPVEAVKRVEQLNRNLREKDKEIETLKSKASQAASQDIISQAVTVGDVKTLITVVSSPDTNTLRQNAEMLRDKLGTSVVLLGAVIGDRVAFTCFVSKELVPRGLHAGNIVALAAKVTGGGGGGRPDMAQAGGKEVDKLEMAMEEARKMVEITLQ
ncbi:MAG: alanine--tRNA ligase, partial [Syntrophomonadaceae bacterium]|nr:alanine--tRNA ligase [Syntrophomonadaceae bacterium]